MVLKLIRLMLIPPPQMGKSVVDSVLMILMSSFVEGVFGARAKIKARSGVLCFRCGE